MEIVPSLFQINRGNLISICRSIHQYRLCLYIL